MNKHTLALIFFSFVLGGCGSEQEASTPPPPAPASEPEATAIPVPAPAPSTSELLDRAIAGDWRDPANVARDVWRHPKQTLEFFGVSADQRVLEIYPGRGWYTEILVPFLRERGHYLGANVDPATAPNERVNTYLTQQNADLSAKLAAHPEVYDKAQLRQIDPASPALGDPGSVDAVLTFRNVHNWMMGGHADIMFKGFYEVLKPGGVLGVVEHRAASDVPAGDKSGYVGQDQVIAMAKAAGFEFEESSDINANPADTKDHEVGVWSLPPSLRLGDKDRAKYEAIGESDRMTLRFRKPVVVSPAAP